MKSAAPNVAIKPISPALKAQIDAIFDVLIALNKGKPFVAGALQIAKMVFDSLPAA